jgi:hypothetical protein
VPSASRICTLVIGMVWSTSNLALLWAGAVMPEVLLPLELTTGEAGAPSLIPAPEKADFERFEGI